MAKIIRGINKNEEKIKNLKMELLLIYLATPAWIFGCFFLFFQKHDMAPYILPIIFMIGNIVLIFIKKHIEKDYYILKSGLHGEKTLVSELSVLNNQYLIMENIELMIQNRRMEMDALIISPYGLTIVECKNHHGNIYGNVNAEEWTQQKTGRKGTLYSSSFKNPLKQIQRTRNIFNMVVHQANLSIPAESIVYFPSCDSIHVNSPEVFSNQRKLIHAITSKNQIVMSENQCRYLIRTILKYKTN